MDGTSGDDGAVVTLHEVGQGIGKAVLAVEGGGVGRDGDPVQRQVKSAGGLDQVLRAGSAGEHDR